MNASPTLSIATAYAEAQSPARLEDAGLLAPASRPDDRNPCLVYLARLTPTSRRVQPNIAKVSPIPDSPEG